MLNTDAFTKPYTELTGNPPPAIRQCYSSSMEIHGKKAQAAV